jgi:hypothetical protein
MSAKTFACNSPGAYLQQDIRPLIGNSKSTSKYTAWYSKQTNDQIRNLAFAK